MTKRFRKYLSILCILAMLLSCAAAGFAEGLPEEEDNAIPEMTGAESEFEEAAPAEAPAEAPMEVPVEASKEVSEEPSGAETGNEVLPETEPAGEAGNEEEKEAPAEPEKEEVVSEPVTIQEAVEEAEEENHSQSEPEPEEEKPAEPTEPEEQEEKQEPEAAEDSTVNKPADPPKEKPEKPEKQEEPEVPEDEPEVILLDLNGLQTVSGILTKESPFALKATDAYSRTVIFTLVTAEEDAVSVTMNDKPVTLNKAENPDPASTEAIYTFEKQLDQNRVYSITLNAERNGYYPFTLSIAEKKETAEEKTEETPEESTAEAQKTEKTDPGLKDNEEAEKAAEEEAGEEQSALPEDRNAVITITWDDENPDYGSVAHFHAELIGYEGFDYTLQWQYSADAENWTDVKNATSETMDIVYSQENGAYEWRIVVDIQKSRTES